MLLNVYSLNKFICVDSYMSHVYTFIFPQIISNILKNFPWTVVLYSQITILTTEAGEGVQQ